MAGSRKIVQIFLASPGDLQDERRSAKEVVDALNKQWADWLGIQVELVGWEDTFKRSGRPQEQINLDLDRCEAFIGMLWRRWGTPPSKDGGPYTSGFEEEFERATGSRKTAGRPEMTLFFKKIDPEFLKDKGPDLVKVLSFKERIEAERSILYEQFDGLPDFKGKTQYLDNPLHSAVEAAGGAACFFRLFSASVRRISSTFFYSSNGRGCQVCTRVCCQNRT